MTFHSDYRAGAASSELVEPVDRELRLGYTRDVTQAVAAVRSLPYADPRGRAGRALDGRRPTLNVLVIRPDLIEAAVLLPPVSTHIIDNLEALAMQGFRAALYDRFGIPTRRRVLPRPADGHVPRPDRGAGRDPSTATPTRVSVAWSEKTVDLLTKADIDASLHADPGDEHVFAASAEQSVAEAGGPSCSRPSQGPTLTAVQVCPRCGAHVADSSRFCTACGTSLSADPSPKSSGVRPAPGTVRRSRSACVCTLVQSGRQPAGCAAATVIAVPPPLPPQLGVDRNVVGAHRARGRPRPAARGRRGCGCLWADPRHENVRDRPPRGRARRRN